MCKSDPNALIEFCFRNYEGNHVHIASSTIHLGCLGEVCSRPQRWRVHPVVHLIFYENGVKTTGRVRGAVYVDLLFTRFDRFRRDTISSDRHSPRDCDSIIYRIMGVITRIGWWVQGTFSPYSRAIRRHSKILEILVGTYGWNIECIRTICPIDWNQKVSRARKFLRNTAFASGRTVASIRDGIDVDPAMSLELLWHRPDAQEVP